MKNKVLISCPTRGDVSVETISFLAKMKKREIEKDDVRILVSKGAPQNPNVNMTINAFLDNYKDCTHVLLINDDLEIHEDVIDMLLEQDKDIIGNIVSIWREDSGIMFCAFNGEHGKQSDIDFAKNKVGKCSWVGGACIMIKRHVLEKYREILGHPIFGVEYNKKTGAQEIGSDERFCRNASTLGFEVWYDARKPIAQIVKVLLTGVYEKGKLWGEFVDTVRGRKLTREEVHG